MLCHGPSPVYIKSNTVDMPHFMAFVTEYVMFEQNKSTGELSFITSFMNSLGSIGQFHFFLIVCLSVCRPI